MEEVEGSNPSRSTSPFNKLALGVSARPAPCPHECPHGTQFRAAFAARGPPLRSVGCPSHSSFGPSSLSSCKVPPPGRLSPARDRQRTTGRPRNACLPTRVSLPARPRSRCCSPADPKRSPATWFDLVATSAGGPSLSHSRPPALSEPRLTSRSRIFNFSISESRSRPSELFPHRALPPSRVTPDSGNLRWHRSHALGPFGSPQPSSSGRGEHAVQAWFGAGHGMRERYAVSADLAARSSSPVWIDPRQPSERESRNAAISWPLRSSRTSPTSAGWFQVLPATAGNRGNSVNWSGAAPTQRFRKAVTAEPEGD